MSELLELSKLALVGLIAGFFASFRSNREFVSQRWWEKKAGVYTRIIEALWMLKDYYEATLSELEEHTAFSEERKKDLQEQRKNGHREVSKAASIGAFFISERAAAALKEFLTRPKDIDEHDMYSLVDHDCLAAKKCLDTVKIEATKDLKTERPFYL